MATLLENDQTAQSSVGHTNDKSGMGYIDKYLVFENTEKQNEFNEFSLKGSPSVLLYAVLIAEILSTVVLLFTSIMRQLPLHIIVPNAVRLLPMLLIACYTYLLKTYLLPSSKSLTQSLSLLVAIGDAYIVSSAAAGGFLIVAMTVPSACGYYACSNTAALKPGTLFLTICFPLLRAIVIKCHTPLANICAMATVSFVVALVLARVDADTFDIALIIAGVIVLVLVTYEYELSLRRIFISQTELQQSVRASLVMENEARVMEMQATELRHLIGNVAHDLKSPLHAFGFELDTLVRGCSRGGKPSQAGDVATISCAELAESVNLLKDICSFMLMAVNRAIDYTKASSGIALVPSLETVDMCHVMAWVKRCNQRNYETTTIEVQPLPPGLCQFIITDKQWLMENLLCLVSNALKFTPAGVITITSSLIHAADTPNRNHPLSLYERPRPEQIVDSSESEYCPLISSPIESHVDHISVKLEPLKRTDDDDLVVYVEVVDGGIGLAHEQRRELFQPFKQAQRHVGGTGLGLFSLSKRVESLGGSCGVSDRLDGQRGCRFWFTIPYHPDEVTAAVEHRGEPCDPGRNSPGVETRQIVSTTSPGAVDVNSPLLCNPPPLVQVIPGSANVPKVENGTDRLRVLLVEDSLMIQKTTARALQLQGYHVDVASNGVECLTCLEQHSYGFVLMDIQMPLMDGLETTRRIREKEALQGKFDVVNGDRHPSCSRMCIIGISANSDSHSEAEAFSAGMDIFLKKPLSITTMKNYMS